MTQAALQFDAHTLLLGLLGMVCGFLAYWGTRLEQRVDELKARQCLLAEEMHKSYVPREDCRERTAQILGVTMPENFRQPFFSKTISEFWKRWHITLGTWFRDYVYIPLGGSRNGNARTVLSLTVVWFFTGLWHGASWNFLIWGLYFAVLLILEKAFLGKLLQKLPGCLIALRVNTRRIERVVSAADPHKACALFKSLRPQLGYL